MAEDTTYVSNKGSDKYICGISVENLEKLNFLEFGTKKTNMSAT